MADINVVSFGTDGKFTTPVEGVDTIPAKWLPPVVVGGDMTLASTQTNSGLKTFLHGTIGLRNILNTFTSIFSNSNTAARTYVLPDADGTIALTSNITDAGLTTTDITTNNFTILKHGFVPKGTNVGNFLKDDGTWSAMVGGLGDVIKVGTPVDNQIGIWTGDGTIEGDTSFTFDTTTNALMSDGNLSLATSGFLGFVGMVAASSSNYSLFGNTSLTILNVRTGGSLAFRIANTDIANFTTTGGFAFGNTYYNIDPGQNNMTIEGRLGIGTSSPQTTLALPSGGILSFEASLGVTDISITHTADHLTLAGGDLIISNLTASEILITDATKQLISAPVATYPSLVELSYIKGLTSAIQTQINAKGVGDALTSGALTQFVGNGNWKVFYSDGSGDIQELALGVAGTVLQSNGITSIPSFGTAGVGDVIKVGTPVDNQVGVWTGNGTIEGDVNLTFDTTTDLLTTALVTANTITANTAFVPDTDGGADLGTTTLGFQNLHLNTGATVNIDNGNWVSTHTSGILTVGTGDLRITTAGTNTASTVTVGGTQTLTNKTLTTPIITSISNTGTITVPTQTGTLLINTVTAGVGTSPTASSTQTITHNLGRIPTIIRIHGRDTFLANAAALPATGSTGIYCSSGNFCIYQPYDAVTITAAEPAATSIVYAIRQQTGVGNFATGVIQNVTSTQFDIVWTETGTHTAQVYMWECQ